MAIPLNTTASPFSKRLWLCPPQSSYSNHPPSFVCFPRSTHSISGHNFLSLQNSISRNYSQLLHVNCVRNHESDLDPDSNLPSLKEAQLDVKLPRRSMLVQFTCNSCGERTQRLINRLAYERGTVFVQCAGCQIHHKLVDNLGLVVEYDLRDEAEADLNGEMTP